MMEFSATANLYPQQEINRPLQCSHVVEPFFNPRDLETLMFDSCDPKGERRFIPRHDVDKYSGIRGQFEGIRSISYEKTETLCGYTTTGTALDVTFHQLSSVPFSDSESNATI